MPVAYLGGIFSIQSRDVVVVFLLFLLFLSHPATTNHPPLLLLLGNKHICASSSSSIYYYTSTLTIYFLARPRPAFDNHYSPPWIRVLCLPKYPATVPICPTYTRSSLKFGSGLAVAVLLPQRSIPFEIVPIPSSRPFR